MSKRHQPEPDTPYCPSCLSDTCVTATELEGARDGVYFCYDCGVWMDDNGEFIDMLSQLGIGAAAGGPPKEEEASVATPASRRKEAKPTTPTPGELHEVTVEAATWL